MLFCTMDVLNKLYIEALLYVDEIKFVQWNKVESSMVWIAHVSKYILLEFEIYNLSQKHPW